MSAVLAIDQGTTSTRALLLAPDGGLTALAQRRHRQHHPRPGRVEHDPLEILADLRACLDAAPRDLAAVAIDNQGESCLGWDARTGEPVGPVLVWQDDRTLPETERLRAAGAEALTLSRAGLPLDPYFSASKLGWILANVSAARDLARAGRLRLGTTDAFFRDRLAGRFETDPTTASRTSLMDLGTCAWDPDLCALFGVPPEALPRIVPTTGDLGGVMAGGRGVPLAASLVDQQAATYGHGCRAPGDAKITFGTGAFALALVGDLPADRHGCLPTVAWARAGEAPAYALDGGVYAAGSAVEWARGLGLFSDHAELDAFDGEPVLARGLAFVPALSGLACPHWDRRARGAWLGMDLSTGPRDLMRALLEGVALRMAEVVEAMDAAVPVASPVSVDGGLSANPWFCATLADALGRPVRVSAEPELTALGAGLLAAEAVGMEVESRASGRVVEPAGRLRPLRPRFAEALRAVAAYGRDVQPGAGPSPAGG